MLRSCATSACEPCQGLTAAALSKKWRVPQGSFNGVNRRENASVRTIKDGAQFSKADNLNRLSAFVFTVFIEKYSKRYCKGIYYVIYC